MALYRSRFLSPAGPITLIGDTRHLLALSFGEEEGERSLSSRQLCRSDPPIEREEEPLRRARRELEAYFAGQRFLFSISLAPQGTSFQLRVWESLRSIPYGTTRSYGEIARRIGAPGAGRAVGAACRANPLAILIPCHRALGKDGSLTGYAGGLQVKEFLLRLERALPGDDGANDSGENPRRGRKR